jgi:purine nucleoside phosphorylase
VTNLAAGLGSGKLVHDDVLTIANKVSNTFLKLLNALVPKLSEQ